MPHQRSDSIAYGQIPYATEQGIFAAITGKFFQRTGNSAPEQGIRPRTNILAIRDEAFGTHRDEPTLDRSRQMKSPLCRPIAYVSVQLSRHWSVNAHKAEATIEALGRVEIVARQDRDNGTRLHFCTPLRWLLRCRPSIQCIAIIGRPYGARARSGAPGFP